MRKYKALIKQLLNDSHEHMTAEEIFFCAKKIEPAIALATVYNNLNTLCNDNEIRKISVNGEPDRYDKTSKPHAHLICNKCKAISDYEIADFSTKLEKIIDKKINTYELNVYYVCDKCLNGVTDNKN